MGSSLFLLLTTQIWLALAISAGIVWTLPASARSAALPTVSVGPQHIHVGSTSRLGGLAVYVGFAAALLAAMQFELIPVRPALPMLIAALPLLAVGLWEDITHRVSPRNRLLSGAVSAMLAITFAQGVIPRLDLPFLDAWLVYLPLAVPLTCFMVVGACNAFNIIDGTNGLAAGSALLALLGVTFVAWNVGDSQILLQSAAMVGALIGFLVWNYPKGRVFLGDAGAYFIGFAYAQTSIELVARNPGVSAWLPVVLAAYPIVETSFSIYRRKAGHIAAMQPDIRHLHSLLYRRFLRAAEFAPAQERRSSRFPEPYSSKERRVQPQCRANARVAPRLWLHGVLCFATGVFFYGNTFALIWFTLTYTIVYTVCYRNAELLSGDNRTVRRTLPFGEHSHMHG